MGKKGTPHRKFGKEEKMKYIRLHLDEHVSLMQIEREYGMFTLSGASEKVDIIQEEIKKYIENISKNGVNTKEFTAVRNALHGSSIRAFDALSYLGRAFGQFYLQGMDAFDYLTTCGKITEEEVNDIIKNLLRGEMAISVVEPKGGFDI